MLLRLEGGGGGVGREVLHKISPLYFLFRPPLSLCLLVSVCYRCV